jgi:hypothetical protein
MKALAGENEGRLTGLLDGPDDAKNFTEAVGKCIDARVEMELARHRRNGS